MKAIHIAQPRAAIELIAAARQLTPDWESWGEQFSAIGREFFGTSLIALNIVERQVDGFLPLYTLSPIDNAQFQALLDSDVDPLPPEEAETMYDWRRVETLDELLMRVSKCRTAVSRIHRCLESAALADGMALTCRAGATQVALSVYSDRPIALSRDEQRLLTQVSLHLEQALRLRLGRATELAIVRPDGRVLHAERALEKQEARERLSSSVRAIERERSRPTVESADIWTGLVRGRLGLSPRQDGPDRHYVVLEHRDPESRVLELSPREMHVAELAAEGLSNKLIAYALGLSEPIVSRTLTAAALKIGCSSARDLVAALALLLRPDPRRTPGASFRPPPSERCSSCSDAASPTSKSLINGVVPRARSQTRSPLFSEKPGPVRDARSKERSPSSPRPQPHPAASLLTEYGVTGPGRTTSATRRQRPLARRPRRNDPQAHPWP